MIFETIQNQLLANSFEIVAQEHNRPWGGFFVISETQAQLFADTFFDGLDGPPICLCFKCQMATFKF